MSKTFTYAGVSRLDGVLTARFANDDKRFMVLVKNGHTDVQIVKLPSAMDKIDATSYLLNSNFANGDIEVETALKLAPKTERVKRASVVKVTAKKAKVEVAEKKLTIEEANARVLATVKEVTPEEAMRRMVFGAVKKRRSRKVVEAV